MGHPKNNFIEKYENTSGKFYDRLADFGGLGEGGGCNRTFRMVFGIPEAVINSLKRGNNARPPEISIRSEGMLACVIRLK